MLNLDDFVASIKTHSIILHGKEYTAKSMTLKELTELQEYYSNAEDGDMAPIRRLFAVVGYPVDELMDLPLPALLKVQEELFASLSEIQTIPATPKVSKK
jgi:hypothetical protein